MNDFDFGWTTPVDPDVIHWLTDVSCKWQNDELVLSTPIRNGKIPIQNKMKETTMKNTLSVPNVEEVIFNEEGRTTIVIWNDNSKTVVHCGEGERFDRYTGFMACVCKKMFGGTTTAKKLMNKLDKKYQAQLKAEKEAEEKAKRIAEAEAAKVKADKLREKRHAEAMEELVKLFIMEAEAKKKAGEILAAKEAEAHE